MQKNCIDILKLKALKNSIGVGLCLYKVFIVLNLDERLFVQYNVHCWIYSGTNTTIKVKLINK